MLIKYIHPKTGTVRDVDEGHENKIRILKRGGFVLFDTYKPRKPKAEKPEKTASDVVLDNKEDLEDQEDVNDPEVAIHVSASARGLIEKNDLDPALIEGSGKDGQITKPDVKDYLKALKESEPIVRDATEEEEAEEETLKFIEAQEEALEFIEEETEEEAE